MSYVDALLKETSKILMEVPYLFISELCLVHHHHKSSSSSSSPLVTNGTGFCEAFLTSSVLGSRCYVIGKNGVWVNNSCIC